MGRRQTGEFTVSDTCLFVCTVPGKVVGSGAAWVACQVCCVEPPQPGPGWGGALFQALNIPEFNYSHQAVWSSRNVLLKSRLSSDDLASHSPLMWER